MNQKSQEQKDLEAEGLLGAVEDDDIVWSGSPRSMFDRKPDTTDTSAPSEPSSAELDQGLPSRP